MNLKIQPKFFTVFQVYIQILIINQVDYDENILKKVN